MDDDGDEDDFINEYREQLHHVDDFVQVVLNGHFDIEGHLDAFLARIFEHQSYLEDARLSFYQKLCVARAYAPPTHQLVEWKIMVMINQIRNKIAHRSRNAPLAIDTSKIREALEGRSESLRKSLQGADHKEVMVHAAAICSGFLVLIEEQLAEYKGEKTRED